MPDADRDRQGDECTGWRREVTACVAAVQFLTRVPLTTATFSRQFMARCPVYFPLVGALIGSLSGCLLMAASCIWPVWLAALLVLAAEAALTGGFHEDAVADFCDAFGGGWTSEDVLRILKDSRIGSFGALGLGLAVALRLAATIEIINHCGRANSLAWAIAIVAGSSLSRFIVVVVMACVPPVQARESLARDIGTQLKIRDLWIAGAVSLPAAIPFVVYYPVGAVLSAFMVVPFTCWMTNLCRRRIGGITGDCLGCIGYCSHVLILLAAAARWQA